THPAGPVCAGAQALRDLPRTLQCLETWGVPVLGWGTGEFPAFYTRSSGLPVAHRVQGPGEVARVLRFRPREHRGVLLTVPIPAEHELPHEEVDGVVAVAVAASARDGVSGPDVTPDVLSRLDTATDGRAVAANVA